jgi:hypothetical protein
MYCWLQSIVIIVKMRCWDAESKHIHMSSESVCSPHSIAPRQWWSLQSGIEHRLWLVLHIAVCIRVQSIVNIPKLQCWFAEPQLVHVSSESVFGSHSISPSQWWSLQSGI